MDLNSAIEVLETALSRQAEERILRRASEHEMNVDAGEEAPMRDFDEMVRLLDKGEASLTAREWWRLSKIVDTMDMGVN